MKVHHYQMNYYLELQKKNNFNVDTANNLETALKKISSKKKKVICIFGSLYLCGNVLNKN